MLLLLLKLGHWSALWGLHRINPCRHNQVSTFICSDCWEKVSFGNFVISYTQGILDPIILSYHTFWVFNWFLIFSPCCRILGKRDGTLRQWAGSSIFWYQNWIREFTFESWTRIAVGFLLLYTSYTSWFSFYIRKLYFDWLVGRKGLVVCAKSALTLKSPLPTMGREVNSDSATTIPKLLCFPYPP